MITRFALAAPCPRRSRPRSRAAGSLLLLLGLLITAASCAAQAMTARADHADGIYSVGDTVTWRVEWSGTSAPPAATYSVKSGGYTEIGSGSLQFTDKVAQLESTFTAPNTLLLEVRWSPTSDANRTWAGAVAAAHLRKAPAICSSGSLVFDGHIQGGRFRVGRMRSSRTMAEGLQFSRKRSLLRIATQLTNSSNDCAALIFPASVPPSLDTKHQRSLSC